MLYYQMQNKNDNYFPHIQKTIVFEELLTEKELNKLKICKDSACFKPIYTSRKNTVFIFGIRRIKDQSKVLN